METPEKMCWFNVVIVRPDGKAVKVSQWAHTTWHAVDKAYNQFCSIQPDRSKYHASLTRAL